MPAAIEKRNDVFITDHGSSRDNRSLALRVRRSHAHLGLGRLMRLRPRILQTCRYGLVPPGRPLLVVLAWCRHRNCNRSCMVRRRSRHPGRWIDRSWHWGLRPSRRRERRSTTRSGGRTCGGFAWSDRSLRRARLSGRRLRSAALGRSGLGRSGLGGGCRGQTSGHRGPRAGWIAGLVSRRRALLDRRTSLRSPRRHWTCRSTRRGRPTR